MSYGPPPGPPGGYGPPPGPPPGGYGPPPGPGYGPPGPPGPGGPGGQPPFNWLIPSILLTFPCCNLLLGIPAIIFATQVNNKWQMGDYHGAQQSAKIAMILCIIGYSLGVLGWGFYGLNALLWDPYYYY